MCLTLAFKNEYSCSAPLTLLYTVINYIFKEGKQLVLCLFLASGASEVSLLSRICINSIIVLKCSLSILFPAIGKKNWLCLIVHHQLQAMLRNIISLFLQRFFERLYVSGDGNEVSAGSLNNDIPL